MTQVSRRPVDKKVYTRMFDIFVNSFIQINNQEKASLFLTELFSDAEQIMISKRLSIAFLLTKKYSFKAISDLLKVSVATICRVNSFVKKNKSGYQTILKEVEKHGSKETGNSFEYLLLMLESLLPPARGTNWKEEKRKLYKRMEELDKSKKPF